MGDEVVDIDGTTRQLCSGTSRAASGMSAVTAMSKARAWATMWSSATSAPPLTWTMLMRGLWAGVNMALLATSTTAMPVRPEARNTTSLTSLGQASASSQMRRVGAGGGAGGAGTGTSSSLMAARRRSLPGIQATRFRWSTPMWAYTHIP